jgi:hypothetical protein
MWAALGGYLDGAAGEGLHQGMLREVPEGGILKSGAS